MNLAVFSNLAKVINIFIIFISLFLLSYILIGCADVSPMYSNVYLVKFELNKKSSVYSSIISNPNFKSKTKRLANLSVRAGYLSACLELEGKTRCTSYSILKSFKDSYSVKPFMETIYSDIHLNLLDLTFSFSKLCLTSILITTILLNIIMLITFCYYAIPFLPLKNQISAFNLFLSLLNTIVFSLCLLLQFKAVNGTKGLIDLIGLNLMTVTIGSRVNRMIWSGLVFTIVTNLLCLLIYLKSKKTSVFEHGNKKNLF